MNLPAIHLHTKLLFLAILLFGGCTTPSTLWFKVVNSRSGDPIKDVEVTWVEFQNAAGVKLKPLPHPPAMSDASGFVLFTNVPLGNRGHSFTFEKDGFLRATAVYDRGQKHLTVTSPILREYQHEGNLINLKKRATNQIYIPLYSQR
jgi:hypothetical protein